MSGTRERSSHASTTENNDSWSKVIPEQGYYYNTVIHASITLMQSQAQNTELREALAKIRNLSMISDNILVPDVSLNLNRSQVCHLVADISEGFIV